MIQLETERLSIRPLLLTDVEGMFILDGDERVQQYLGMQVISSRAEALDNIKFIRNQYEVFGVGRSAVIEKSTNRFVGWTGFKMITDGQNGVESYLDLGYRFIYDAWGKGYATEAAVACLEYADIHLTTLPIHAISEVGNSASRHVLEKIGFRVKNVFVYHNVDHFWYIR